MQLARALVFLTVLSLVASCSNTSDSEVDERLAALERRVFELERSGNADTQAVSGGSELPTARSLQEVQQDAAGRIESLESVETVSLIDLSTAAFEDSLFFGFPLDEEFGGVSIEGDDQVAEILLVGQGLEDLGLLEVLLDALAVPSPTTAAIMRVDSGGSELLDGSNVLLEWNSGNNQLRVSIGRSQ